MLITETSDEAPRLEEKQRRSITIQAVLQILNWANWNNVSNWAHVNDKFTSSEVAQKVFGLVADSC